MTNRNFAECLGLVFPTYTPLIKICLPCLVLATPHLVQLLAEKQLGALHIDFHASLQETGSIIIPILQMEVLRCTECNVFNQDGITK